MPIIALIAFLYAAQFSEDGLVRYALAALARLVARASQSLAVSESFLQEIDERATIAKRVTGKSNLLIVILFLVN